MKIKYDNKADAVYINLAKIAPKTIDTQEIADDIFVDYDNIGQPVGIEILGVKNKVPAKTLLFLKNRPKGPDSSK